MFLGRVDLHFSFDPKFAAGYATSWAFRNNKRKNWNIFFTWLDKQAESWGVNGPMLTYIEIPNLYACEKLIIIYYFVLLFVLIAVITRNTWTLGKRFECEALICACDAFFWKLFLFLSVSLSPIELIFKSINCSTDKRVYSVTPLKSLINNKCPYNVTLPFSKRNPKIKSKPKTWIIRIWWCDRRTNVIFIICNIQMWRQLILFGYGHWTRIPLNTAII